MDTQLKRILEIAQRVQAFFQSNSDEILDAVRAATAASAVAHNRIACDGNMFMVVAEDPPAVFNQIIANIRKCSAAVREKANPITILTKLVDAEYMLDVNGTRLCYGLRASVASQFLLKAVACKILSSVHGFYAHLDAEKKCLTGIDEVQPDFDYAAPVGGSKKKRNRVAKPAAARRASPRQDIIQHLHAFVQEHADIAKGIIFVGEIEEAQFGAANIIYTDRRFRDAIIDFIKLYVQQSVPDVRFKAFLHNDFHIPYDFQLTKHSCLINDVHTDKPTYIANLYNIAAHMPVPCIADGPLLTAHPIIKLRLLYVDMFVAEHKTREVAPKKHVQAYAHKLQLTFDAVQTATEPPIWVGYYTDEAHAKIQVNMRSRGANAAITQFV